MRLDRLLVSIVEVVLVSVVFLSVLCGCADRGQEAQFREGDIVVHRTSGQEGQIIDVPFKNFGGNWIYKVRFAFDQSVAVKSGNHIIQKAFTVEHMREYELGAKEK